MSDESIKVVSNTRPAPSPAAPAAEEGEKKPVEGEATVPAPAPVEGEEVETTSESEPEETEEEGETGESTEEEPEGTEKPEGEAAAAAGKDEKPKKKNGFQRKVNKLNARISDAQREAEFWKAKALQNASGTQPKPEETRSTVESVGKPKADDYTSNDDYVEALTEWKVNEKLAAREAKAAQTNQSREAEKIIQAHAARVSAFKAKTPDFDDVIEEADDQVELSPTMQHLIINSDLGPDLLYALSKNPEEANRIAKLPPLAAAEEMTKLKIRIAPKTSAAPTTKKITKAPKPLEPVGSGGGSVKKSIHDKNLTMKEYNELRDAQEAARSKRA